MPKFPAQIGGDRAALDNKGCSTEFRLVDKFPVNTQFEILIAIWTDLKCYKVWQEKNGMIGWRIVICICALGGKNCWFSAFCSSLNRKVKEFNSVRKIIIKVRKIIITLKQ